MRCALKKKNHPYILTTFRNVSANKYELTHWTDDSLYCPTYCGIQWCNGYGMLLILFVLTYIGLFYYQIVKPLWGARIYKTILWPINRAARAIFSQQ